MEKNKISIVVPCFNEKEALPLFYNKITQVFNQMSQESETAGLSYELIIVDDGYYNHLDLLLKGDELILLIKSVYKKDNNCELYHRRNGCEC